jgi:tetratricopeptide (TPR) repeat protein
MQLFRERGAASSPKEIDDAYQLTEGHAFWLDLLAVQVAKRAAVTNLTRIVEDIRRGAGPLPAKTLNSIWATLRDRERRVLRAMAETVKPETEVSMSDYLDRELNYNQVVKALNALRALNLVVVKRRPGDPDVLELHPLVRQFVRQSFPAEERRLYIDSIIRVYRNFIARYKGQLSAGPSFSTLQYWTQHAELDITAGKLEDAFATLAEAASAFRASAYPREFSRTARMVLSSFDWAAEHHRFREFDAIVESQVEIVSHLGEYGEADALLDQYETTVPDKNARYIGYCRLRCLTNWVRGEFIEAIRWGKIGRDLKGTADVDVNVDIAHYLALAERDAGRPESALPVFLGGRALSDVLDPDELDGQRGGPHYGNIGRCLHFMGQIDNALVCYQKSAVLVEKQLLFEHVLNQGYIRFWIGELLAARRQLKLAQVFLRAACAKWETAAPPKASKARLLLGQVEARAGLSVEIDDEGAERVCLDWIAGRPVESRFD